MILKIPLKFIQLLIILYFLSFQITAQKRNDPHKLTKKNETIEYGKLKIKLPIESIVIQTYSQTPYLKIYPNQNEDFLLIVRKYSSLPNFENPNLTELEKSFLQGAKYLPTTNYNFIESFRIKKWISEVIVKNNDLIVIVYLIEKEKEFYTIWIAYRKQSNELDKVFQKVDFFTNP